MPGRSMNLKYAKPGPYFTDLTPEQEQMFKNWVMQNKVPFDLNEKYPEYDMRGFFQAMLAGDPHASSGIDPYDKQMHFTDYWKTPWHPTFSRESKYATEEAPFWKDNRYLIDKDGNILFDAAEESKRNAVR